MSNKSHITIIRILIGLTLMLMAGRLNAQIKVGDNPANVNPDAVLEIESADKGLLLPRIALTSTIATTPLSDHVAGMTVYNTASSGSGETAVTPGYYYNNGTQWVRIVDGAAIKTEPWNIQNTTTDATLNTQDIYQQGKVAVGFTQVDGVSNKQLEVKGDMRVTYDNGVGVYSIVDNNYIGYAPEPSGPTLLTGEGTNVISSSDNEDLNSASKSNVLMATNDFAGFGAAMMKSQDGVHLAGATVSASPLASSAALAVRDDTNRVIEIQATTTFGIRMGDAILGGARAHINAHNTDGINFSFIDTNGNNEGEYYFPRNNGTANQVLTTDGNMGGQLSWQNANNLIQQPWNIQNTPNDATLNTQDIYQQGKVAIGFTDADEVSDKQFEVKGDAKFNYEFNHAGTDAQTGFESNHPLAPGASVMYSMGNGEWGSTVVTAPEYAGIHFQDLEEDINSWIGGNGVSVALANGKSGVWGNNLHMNEGRAHLTVDHLSGNYETRLLIDDNVNGRIELLSADYGAGSSGSHENQSALFVEKGQGVRFEHYDTSGDITANYLFPTTGGVAGQVLTTAGGTGGQLSWQDAGNLVQQPWNDQDTGNDATLNTQDIYQMGKVGIGTNNMLGTADPDVVLALNGSMLTTTSIYADYVFEDYFEGKSELNEAYSFKTLAEIEQFINENRHLPGIAKIDTLTKNEKGDYIINPTELSVQLLEKVEELYLHTIEQQRTLETKDKEIEALKKTTSDMEERLNRLEKLIKEQKITGS